mgnify:CR=1 FL=1
MSDGSSGGYDGPATATFSGGAAGVLCLAGGLILLHRRMFDPRIRANSSFGDAAILALLIGQVSLRRAVDEFMSHYHLERNHQGLGNQLIREWARNARTDGPVQRRQRLGGMLSFYYKAAV